MMVLRPEGFLPNRRRKLELHAHDTDGPLDEPLYEARQQ
jgi:hypothetical protein